MMKTTVCQLKKTKLHINTYQKASVVLYEIFSYRFLAQMH